MTLSDAVADYCTSQHFLFLEDGLKGHAERLLAQWATDLDHNLDFDALQASIQAVGQFDLPVEIKRAFPSILDAFFEYLSTTASFPKAELWQDYLIEIGMSYTNSIRDDGSVRGQTVTRALTIGRNDPCPCGSGRKYKRCCGG